MNQNHNNRSPGHKGEDRNYMQSLMHQSSAPETYYEKIYDSSNEVSSGDGLNDRGRNRRGENSASQINNKKQYQLDLEKLMQHS